MCILCTWLCICVLDGTIQSTEVQFLYFKPRMSRSIGDVAGTAKKCQLLYRTTIFFKVLYCKIKNVFFMFYLFFMYYLCEKYYKPIAVQYYIADHVIWLPRRTSLDL